MRSFPEKVATLAVDHPIRAMGLALAIGLASAILTATLLKFDSSFAALLPEDAPELLEVRELQAKAGGTVEMVVAVTGADGGRRLAFARKLVKTLRKKPWIMRADVEYPAKFFEDRRLLLLSTRRLERLAGEIDEEIAQAKLRANPLYVDLEDDEGKKKPAWADLDRTERGLGLPARTLTSSDGRYLFIRIKPRGTSVDMGLGKQLLGQIKDTIAAAEPKRAGVYVQLAGGLVVNQEQHSRMTGDLKHAFSIALVLILALMTFHIRRLPAPFILSVPLLLGVITTLGVTAVTIGQLNMISGFLVSALLGLGIDFEIHLYLRYLEELSICGDRRQALRLAIIQTLPPCLTSAATTSAAFFAMMISNFRGFREYGLIAGVGVLITLLMSFLALPPMALFIGTRGKRPRAVKADHGFHRGLAWSMVVIGSGMLIFSLVAGQNVRWHNNFRELRGVSENVDFTEWVVGQLGGSLSPAAILVSSLEEARRVERYLEPRTKDPRSEVKRYISLASMIPSEAAKKEAILKRINRSLVKTLDADLTAADRKQVKEAIRLSRARAWTVDQIPAAFRKQFLTLDGKEQFVVVWPRSEMFVDREIIAWGTELHRIRKDLHALGIPVKIMDENRLGARVLEKMRAQAPVVVLAGALAVLMILIIDFRNLRQVLLVGSSVAVGVAWLAGAMYVGDLSVNVFNLAVIPTIIGISIDNAVHIQHRYKEEGPGSLAKVVATTGSAALLASATTAIGFGAAVTAHHMGIRSLGWLTILGLSCAFVSSTIFFPSVLRVIERRKR